MTENTPRSAQRVVGQQMVSSPLESDPAARKVPGHGNHAPRGTVRRSAEDALLVREFRGDNEGRKLVPQQSGHCAFFPDREIDPAWLDWPIVWCTDPNDRPSDSAVLVVERGPNAGSRFLLDRPVTTAGRHAGSDIFLEDVTVSRRHAEFRRDSGEIRVVDIGSLSGTYVNSKPVDSVVLTNGDEIQIGRFRLVFLSSPRPVDTQDPTDRTAPSRAAGRPQVRQPTRNVKV